MAACLGKIEWPMFPLPDFLRPLENLTRPFPRGALEEAIARREESTPYLMEAIEWAEQHADEVARSDFMLHLFALHLLAQFREKRAYRAIVRLARHPAVDQFVGGTITETLAGVIASVCDGGEMPIRKLIEDELADKFARGAGLRALGARVLAGQAQREEFSAHVGELFEHRLEREPGHIWDALVSMCVDLRMTGHLEAIRRAFRDGLADPHFQSLEQTEAEIILPAGGWLADKYDLIDDTVAVMSDWYCFDPRSEDDLLGDWLAEEGQPPSSWRPPEPKIARNAPCPCGSGSKYKNCCGALN